ncbi:MAG: tetratricopeptide repeat protein [Candidatus Nealsonbacteria bacterium]|nr:tetratricopeptide repeat protein [Candidatus Nealsonbacteria bacterium]
MEFSIRCACGREIEVASVEAGTDLVCACGIVVEVPSREELRREAESPEPESPEPEPSPPDAADDQPPREFMMPLHTEPQLRQRIHPEAFFHFALAATRATHDYFEQVPLDRGIDLQVACALLPDGNRIVSIRSCPDGAAAESLCKLAQRLEELATPPVRDGPVAFVARSMVGGGCDRLPVTFDFPFAECGAGPESLDTVLMRAGGLQADLPAVVQPAARSAGAVRRPGAGGLWQRITRWVSGLFAGTRARNMHRRQIPPLLAGLLSNAAEARSQHDSNDRESDSRVRDRIRRANRHKEQGEFKQAVAEYDNLIALEPGNVEVLVARAEAYYLDDQSDRALAGYDEALRLDPGHAAALNNRGMIQMEREAWERAIADLDAALQIDPLSPSLHVNRARIHLARESFPQALDDLNEALRLDPYHDDAYALRGLTHRQLAPQEDSPRKEPPAEDPAVADFTAAIEINPESAWLYARRAEARMARGETELVLADCDQAIELDPECSLAFGLRGVVHQQEDKSDEAVEDCSEAIRLGLEVADVYFSRSVVYFDRDDLNRALADCTRALELDPEHVGGHNGRGLIRAQMGLAREAIEDYAAAIRLAPRWPIPYLNRGNLYGMQGDHDSALEDFDEAIRLDPEFAPSYYSRANAWGGKGEFARAIEDCDEAIRLDPDFAPAFYCRGMAWDRLGVHGEAIFNFDDAIRLYPSFGPAFAGRGNVRIKQGDYDKAIEDYREAINRHPGAAGQLEEIDEDYAARAVAAGLAESEPGIGNLTLAVYLAQHESIESAMEQCEAALRELPVDAVLSTAVAVLRHCHEQITDGHIEQVASWFDRAIKVDADCKAVQLQLAMFRDLQQRYDELCGIYRRLLDRDDLSEQERALTRNNLAYFLAVAQRDDEQAGKEALEMIEQAIEVIGPVPELLDTRAMAQLVCGDADAAVADLRRVVTNGPSGIRYYHLAAAHLAAGDRQAARDALDTAREEHQLASEHIPGYEQKMYDEFVEALGAF